MTRHQPTSYLLPHEAAAILQVSTKTVARWAKEGRLPFVHTLGGHRRYNEDEIRRVAEQMRQDATDGPLVATR